jgi:hypothetical protein
MIDESKPLLHPSDDGSCPRWHEPAWLDEGNAHSGTYQGCPGGVNPQTALVCVSAGVARGATTPTGCPQRSLRSPTVSDYLDR